MEPEGTPIVPAQRLLDVAGALADGAARMHAQLNHLEPAQREALLELVTGQVGTIVDLWADLVRGVVTAVPEPPRPAVGGRDHLAPIGEPRIEQRPAGPTIQVVPDASPGTRSFGEPPGGAARRTAPPPDPSPADGPDALNRDELTGVLNRPAGMAALHRDIDRCRQSGVPLVLGYLNVDGLRQVNDTQGPRAGDELLRKITAALRATLRSHDVVLRLGGDEFLFSLPGADVPTAEQRLREFSVILSREAPGASASVGFAELRDGDAPEDLVARADQALITGRLPRRRVR